MNAILNREKDLMIRYFRLLLCASALAIAVNIFNSTEPWRVAKLVLVCFVFLVLFLLSFGEHEQEKNKTFVKYLSNADAVAAGAAVISSVTMCAYLLTNTFIDSMSGDVTIGFISEFCKLVFNVISPIMFVLMMIFMFCYFVVYNDIGLNSVYKFFYSAGIIFLAFFSCSMTAAMFTVDGEVCAPLDWIRLIIETKGYVGTVEVVSDISSEFRYDALISALSSAPILSISFGVPTVIALIAFIHDGVGGLTRDPDKASTSTLTDIIAVLSVVFSYKTAIDINMDEYKRLPEWAKTLSGIILKAVQFLRQLPLYGWCFICSKLVSLEKVIFEDNNNSSFQVNDEYVDENIYNKVNSRIASEGGSMNRRNVRMTAVKPHAKISYHGHTVPTTAYVCPHCGTTIPKRNAYCMPASFTRAILFGILDSGKTTVLNAIYNTMLCEVYDGSAENDYYELNSDNLAKGILPGATSGILTQSPMLIVRDGPDHYVGIADSAGEISHMQQHCLRSSDSLIFVIDTNNIERCINYCQKKLRNITAAANGKKYNKAVLLFTKIDLNDDLELCMNARSEAAVTENFEQYFINNERFMMLVEQLNIATRSYSITGVSTGYFNANNEYVFDPKYLSELVRAARAKRW